MMGSREVESRVFCDSAGRIRSTLVMDRESDGSYSIHEYVEPKQRFAYALEESRVERVTALRKQDAYRLFYERARTLVSQTTYVSGYSE